MKKRKQGWFRKAKIKFIEREIYSYELTRQGMFGSYYIEVRRKPKYKEPTQTISFRVPKSLIEPITKYVKRALAKSKK